VKYRDICTLPTGTPPDLIIESAIKRGYCLDTVQLAAYINSVNRVDAPQDALLWVVDMRTLAHPIYNGWAKYLEDNAGKVGTISLTRYARLRWYMAFLNIHQNVRDILGSGITKVRIVVADDNPAAYPGFSKPIYWRHHMVPTYKDGRPAKPNRFNEVTDEGYKAAADLGIPVLREPYFEADDFIAAMARDNSPLGDVAKMGIFTVDTDLMQLINERVFWYNVGPWVPLLRDEDSALAYWLKRHKRPISHPRDIAAFKAEHGDVSDNLPPGTDIRVIDLLNPPTQPIIDWAYLSTFEPLCLDKVAKMLKGFQLEAMLNKVPVQVY